MPKHVRAGDQPQQATESKYRNWDAYQSDSEFEPFKELLQRDPRVCDNCFILRYEDVSFEWKCGELGWLSYSQFIPLHREERHESIRADHVTDGMRLACGNCGHRRGKTRPLPKERVREVAANISQTLDEKGIDHDSDLLLTVVRERNCSANQGRQDSDVFAPAVAAALRDYHGSA